jgi:Starch-binding associating with outer membrane
MNIRRIYKVLFVLPLALLAGCADFLDVNDTPNNPLDVPQSTILPSALVATGFANANELNRFYSTVSDYLYGAAGGPAAYDTYVLTGGDFGNQWTGELWNGALIQYDRMIKKGEAEGSYAYVGIAKIMQAYTWSLVTDTWGDIPYSQALKGDENVTRPELDSQEDIYKGNPSKGVKSLFDLTREGIADLDKPSLLTPGVDDVVYGGNIANWKRAGYTLMLRMAMTISAKEPALAASIVNEVLAAGNYITANSQNLAVKFGGSVGSQSPIYSYMFVTTFQNDMTVSTRYVTLLENGAAADDPRLPLFVKKGVTAANGTTPTAGYVTFENGFRGTLPGVFQFTKWNNAVTGANGVGPVRLVTNAGRAFMLAEAILNLPGVNAGALTAQNLFYEGMRASLTEAGATTAEIDAYIGATNATPTPRATLSATKSVAIDQIITQKYIAMTGNGLDAWNDIRRTGFPSHTAVEHANAAGEDGKRPVRARYPDSDIARNPNLGAAVKKTNERVWWDAN